MKERGEVLPVGVREEVEVRHRERASRGPAAARALHEWTAAHGHRHGARSRARPLTCLQRVCGKRWLAVRARGCEMSLQGRFNGLRTWQWPCTGGAPAQTLRSVPSWPAPLRSA